MATIVGPDEARLRRAFLEEGEELVQKLGETLSALEAAPDGPELINEVFRLTHSLKSESALMGYSALSGLAHAMEDVLGMARAGECPLGKAALERLVAGADRSAAMMSSIARGAGDTADGDAADVVRDLQALMGERAAESAKGKPPSVQPQGGPVGEEPAFSELDRRRIDEARERGEWLVRMTVSVAPDEPMKFARAYLVFNNLEQAANVITTVPPLDGQPAGDAGYERTVFYLTTDRDEDALRAAARVDQVESAIIERMDFPASGETPEAGSPGATAVSAPQVAAVPAPQVAAVPAAAAERASIRVDTRKLDDLWSFVAELVVHKSHLSRLSEGAARGMDPVAVREELIESSDSLEKISSGMQQAMRDTRMIPISVIFNKFPRLVRDLSRKLGKPVDLAMSGVETEIDRSIVEALSDPLTHIIRNSLDHGLEYPEERVRAGKPERGKVTVDARRQGGTIVIEVADDGRGLDTARIRQTAVERGIPGAAGMSDAELRELVFLPGFSTKEVVTDLSGRGVGMDVVATRIRNDLRGDVELASEAGRGTRVILRLPLTLTIVNSLLVEDGGRLYAIPLTDMDSTAKVAASEISQGEEGESCRWMEETVRLYSLRGLLGGERESREEYFAAVLRHGNSRGLLLVDALIEEREIVIRPVDDLLNPLKLFSGVSVLDDGRLVFILDTSFIRHENF